MMEMDCLVHLLIQIPNFTYAVYILSKMHNNI
jgi:hypothetical protein